MSHRCCCDVCAGCGCENCQLGYAPCCMQVTFRGIENGEGENGCALCETFVNGSIVLAHIGSDCGWTINNVWGCDVTTVNCGIYKVDDEYIVRVSFDDILFEKNLGLVKPWCWDELRGDTMYGLELELVSSGNGETCRAIESTISDAVADEDNSGVDDCMSGGIYDPRVSSSSFGLSYIIEIDKGDPDTNTFRWGHVDGGWNYENINITPGESQTLDCGITITFDDDSGHVTDDFWTFTAKKSACYVTTSCDLKTNYGIIHISPPYAVDTTLHLCACGWAVGLGVECFCLEVTINDLWLPMWELTPEGWVEHCCEEAGKFGIHANSNRWWGGFDAMGAPFGVCTITLLRDMCSGEYYMFGILSSEIGGGSSLYYISHSLGTSVNKDELNGMILYNTGHADVEVDEFCNKPLAESYMTISCTDIDNPQECRDIHEGFESCF